MNLIEDYLWRVIYVQGLTEEKLAVKLGVTMEQYELIKKGEYMTEEISSTFGKMAGISYQFFTDTQQYMAMMRAQEEFDQLESEEQ